jgi:LysM repeat protein
MKHETHLTRRQVLSASLALGLGAALVKGTGRGAGVAHATSAEDTKHLVWVWQFTTDAAPHLIGARLRDHGLGLLLKTHDGLEWMSKYDKSPFAVSGPAQAGVLSRYYEAAGVPFHAWAVVHGVDPIREAQMSAEILGAGARSIYLDVEPHAGFWRGSPADAEAYGRELRRLQPNAKVVLSIDPRPWMLPRLPLKEFASWANEIAPQNYWRTFNTQANYDKFLQTGFPVPPEGVTPEFLVDVSNKALAPYGLPIIQVGQGATPDRDEWRRFIDGTYSSGGKYVTVWRYGVTGEDIFGLLKEIPPKLPPPPAAVIAPIATGTHVVAEGETLGIIAGAHGTSVENLMALNGLSDPNYVYVGQELKIGGGTVAAVAVSVGSASSGTVTTATTRYTVVDGDTLFAIADRFDTTPEAIAQLNGLSDLDSIAIGLELNVPS